MRTDNIKVRLAIPIPVDKSDLNGVVFTKESVLKINGDMLLHTPIVYKDNDSDEKVIGMISEPCCFLTGGSENQVYELSVYGTIFYGGADIIVNEIEDGKITDFEIRSIGLTV